MWKLARLLYLCLALLLLSGPRPLYAQENVRVVVVAQQANVRADPSPDAAILGILRQGALIDTLILSNGWYKFLYWDTPAWINANVVEPVGRQQREQTGAIRLNQYTIDPIVPGTDQPFLIYATLSTDRDLGAFKIATNCSQFTLLNIPRLAAGVAQAFAIQCSGNTATGPHESALIIDTDRSVSNGISLPIAYWVDRPYTQMAVTWPAYSDLNVDGQDFDLAFDGVVIRGINGTRLWPLADTDLAALHYDALSAPEKIYEMVPPNAGSVYGMQSASGSRGALYIMQASFADMSIEFRVYQ